MDFLLTSRPLRRRCVIGDKTQSIWCTRWNKWERVILARMHDVACLEVIDG